MIASFFIILMAKHFLHEKNTGSNSGVECPICCETFTDSDGIRLNTECIGNTWIRTPCEHWFCVDCYTQYIEVQIADGRWRLTCPQAECKVQLFEADLVRMLGNLSSVYKRWFQLSTTDYSKRLNNLDEMMATWLLQNGQTCPSCSVMLQRSDGCNYMRCICGIDFCYVCKKYLDPDGCTCYEVYSEYSAGVGGEKEGGSICYGLDEVYSEYPAGVGEEKEGGTPRDWTIWWDATWRFASDLFVFFL